MEKEGIWSESFTVQSFMVDNKRKIRLPMLCNLLQETAGNHANFRALGFFEMQANHRFWVLNRLKVEIYEKVEWLEHVEVQTWVSLMRGPFSHRHFSVRNQQGQEVASAFTLWVALDATSRRPVRIEAKGLPLIADKIASCGPASKIPAIENRDETFFYEVQYSDLDMINHVNNVKYLEWVLDTYKNAESLSDIHAFEVNYLNETGPSEKVQIAKSNQAAGDLFSLQLENSGTEVCRIQLHTLRK